MSIITINPSDNIAEKFISSVKEGGTVEVSPGEYFFDTVPVLQDGITIRPAVPDSNVMLNGKFFVMGSDLEIKDMKLQNHNGSIVLISDENASVFLNNCDLSQNSSKLPDFAMVYVEKGKFSANFSKFHDSPSNAILITKGSNAEIEKCSFYNMKKVSIFIKDEGSNALIRFSTIANNQNSGIRVSDGGDLFLRYSELINCQYSGLAVVKNSKASVNDTKFKDMPLNAIYVSDKSHVNISTSNFHEINSTPIYISNESSIELIDLNLTDLDEDFNIKAPQKTLVKAISSTIFLSNRHNYISKYGPNCFDLDSSSTVKEYENSTPFSIFTIRDRKDVQEVLSKLKPNDIIEIYPGNYYFGDVIIPEELTGVIVRPIDDRNKPIINAKFLIKGKHTKLQDLILYNNNGSIIQVESDYVFVENCDISQPDSNLQEFSAVYVKKGMLFITNCIIHNTSSNGVLAEKSSNTIIENVKFENTKKSSIFIKGKETYSIISGCSIKNTLNNGLTAIDAEHITLLNCEFSNSKYASVYLNNSNISITNLNVNYSPNAVYAKNGSKVSIIDSKFNDISKSVFLVQDADTEFNIHKNIVLKNFNGYFIEKIDNHNVKIENEEDYKKMFKEKFMKQ